MGLETIATAAGAGATAYGAYQARNASNQQTAAQENAWTRLYDPTNPMLRGLAQGQIGTLGAANAGQNIFAQHTNPLQTQGLSAVSGLMGEGNNFERMAFNATYNRLNSMANGEQSLGNVGTGFQRLGFSDMPQAPGFARFDPGSNPYATQMGVQQAPVFNPQASTQRALDFGRVQTQQVGANPFAATQGFVNPGQTAINMARPQFEQSLQAANTQLSQTAPSRFSSAFAADGIDLNARALNDFNMFAGQQLMAGEQLRAQEQAAAQQFMLSAAGQNNQSALASQELFQQGQTQARGLEQGFALDGARLGLDAAAANNQSQLASRGLAQQAFGQQQQLGLDAQTQFVNALMQAFGIQSDNTNQLRNANLAGMGQQLQADGQNQQFALGQAGLNSQNILAAIAQMMSNAQATGAGQFGRAAAGAGLGMQATQNTINPLLQTQLAGYNYAVPSDLNAVIGGAGIQNAVQVPGGANTPPPPGSGNDFGNGGQNPTGGDGGGDPGYWNPQLAPGTSGYQMIPGGFQPIPAQGGAGAVPGGNPNGLFTYNNEPYIMQNGKYVKLNMSFDQARQLYGAEVGLSNDDVRGRI